MTKTAKKRIEDQPEALPAPTSRERVAIATAQNTAKTRLAPPRVKGGIKDGVMEIGSPHEDGRGWEDHLRNAFGTLSRDFMACQLQLIMDALRQKGQLQEGEINGALALISGMAAENEMQAAMAVQIAVSHVLSIRMLGKASNAQLHPQLDSFINAATKLQRTMAAQIETLAAVRRGGKQQVIVKHVHVYQGANGRAVIGDVHPPGGQLGAIENERQPHGSNAIGTIALAHGEAVLSEEPERQPMHVAGRSR